MKIAVFQWFRCFVGSPPFGASCWPPRLLLASCCPLASCWPLAGFLLASCWPLAGPCWPLAGLLLASCWLLAGLLLASCWPLAGLVLASCGPFARLLLATSFPTKISLENRFFTRLAKLVNSLHENSCFSMVSVFRGVPHNLGPLPGLLVSCWPLAGLLLASCWFLAGFLLASCWPLAGLLLASCWALAGLLLASCWPLAGYKLSHEDFSRKSVFHKARKIGEFSS